jgi:hypothetical protein
VTFHGKGNKYDVLKTKKKKKLKLGKMLCDLELSQR